MQSPAIFQTGVARLLIASTDRFFIAAGQSKRDLPIGRFGSFEISLEVSTNSNNIAPMGRCFTKPRGLACLGAVGLGLLTILIYRPAWHGGFIWDDDRYVTHNHLLTAPDGLRRIWFSLDAPSQYFPLAYTVLRIERSFWDLNPAGYHLVNIFLHLGNALLVWCILSRFKVPSAWLAGEISSGHPNACFPRANRPVTDCEPRCLVLPQQNILAIGPHLHLSAMAD